MPLSILQRYRSTNILGHGFVTADFDDACVRREKLHRLNIKSLYQAHINIAYILGGSWIVWLEAVGGVAVADMWVQRSAVPRSCWDHRGSLLPGCGVCISQRMPRTFPTPDVLPTFVVAGRGWPAVFAETTKKI